MITRRDFLKRLGIGAGAAAVGVALPKAELETASFMSTWGMEGIGIAVDGTPTAGVITHTVTDGGNVWYHTVNFTDPNPTWTAMPAGALVGLWQAE